MNADLVLQTSLTVYGDGPYNPDLDCTTGNEDVATIRFDPAYALIRKADYERLRADLGACRSLIAAVKANVSNQKLSDDAFRQFVGRILP